MQKTKCCYAYRGYENIYNVEILRSLKSELQLKDTEFKIK